MLSDVVLEVRAGAVIRVGLCKQHGCGCSQSCGFWL